MLNVLPMLVSMKNTALRLGGGGGGLKANTVHMVVL